MNDDEVSKLKNNLHQGIVEVTFIKANGDERVMKCTLDPDVVPETTGTKTVNRNEEAQPVYDVVTKGWRSFRWDSVKSIAFGV